MCSKSVISLIILYLSFDVVHLSHHQHQQQSAGWDFLVFSQQWPETTCKVWTHKKPNHSCIFPKDKTTWTIHGVWPSDKGHFGPENCNSTWLFDPEQVKPIENDLEQAWTNIEKGTGLYDFWAHEWTKHGTCATDIEAMNNEFKYFNKGLELHKTYAMSTVLEAANILPSDTKPVSLEEINEAIIARYGKRPMIQCKYEDHVQYIFEIRLCLDKQLTLVDCDDIGRLYTNTRDIRGAITNCNVNAHIIYPDREPPKRHLVQLYKFINWLQWFTL